ALMSADYEEFDHRTGATWDRAGALTSLRWLMRSREPDFRHQVLATLGDALVLARRRVAADGAAGARFDVGAYDSRARAPPERGADRRCVRQEVFAADRLGDAVVRLYERYAELLPEAPERNRMAAAARSIAANVVGRLDLDRMASEMAPAVDHVDHRTVGFGSVHGVEQTRAALGALFELATDVATRGDEDLALD